MEANYISISYGQLTLSILFILINIVLSLVLRLGLERSLFIASVRMVLQLLLVGYVLEWVFTLQNPFLVILVALGMTTIAGISSISRTRRRFQSIYWNNFVSLLSASFLVTGITVSGIIRVHPWYDPQYLIPFFGMVLGNALTGTSLTLDRFMEDLTSKRQQVEALLTLGATRSGSSASNYSRRFKNWYDSHNKLNDGNGISQFTRNDDRTNTCRRQS
ncbi:hypothetical protein CAL7716_103270 (plasmid) [Calothrix sp. PCC 7716]|nr:hypothetical protein CAL7716_103270 [Calothrix sp. PCC 7716]